MKSITRRNFMEKSLAIGATGLVAPSTLNSPVKQVIPPMTKDDISLAQWALIEEISEG